MGYLHAYIRVDQEEIKDYIHNKNINKDDDEHTTAMAQHFFEKATCMSIKHCEWVVRPPCYEYIQSCDFHELYIYYPIAADERFTNERLHQTLEKKYGYPFPGCLYDMPWGIRAPQDANVAALSLRLFFPHDTRIQRFADWLEKSSLYCTSYQYTY